MAAVALTDLEITTQIWLTWNLQRSSCFGFLSDEITSVHHYVLPPLTKKEEKNVLRGRVLLIYGSHAVLAKKKKNHL